MRAFGAPGFSRGTLRTRDGIQNKSIRLRTSSYEIGVPKQTVQFWPSAGCLRLDGRITQEKKSIRSVHLRQCCAAKLKRARHYSAKMLFIDFYLLNKFLERHLHVFIYISTGHIFLILDAALYFKIKTSKVFFFSFLFV